MQQYGCQDPGEHVMRNNRELGDPRRVMDQRSRTKIRRHKKKPKKGRDIF